jgi:DNA-binding MarR family transcriptional regulator
MERHPRLDTVVRALRRVNIQGSLFGNTIAIRLGLSESDVEALEMLIEDGAATAGRLAEVMGLTTGAVTRMVDRLEQAGYVRRVADPADRRRVVVEPVPEKVAAVRELIDTVGTAAAREIGRYSPEQLELINDFLERMAETTRTERERLRSSEPAVDGGEHAAPIGGLREARLLFRSGASDITLHDDPGSGELYRAHFEGPVPQVRLRDGVVSVQYKSRLFDFRKPKADLALSAAVPWSIEVRGGTSHLRGELAQVPVRQVEFSGGASRIELNLGRPVGIVPIRVTGGASDVRVRRPADVPVRLVVHGGASSVELDEQRIGGTSGVRLESGSASGAADLYTIEVTGGVSDIKVKPSKR